MVALSSATEKSLKNIRTNSTSIIYDFAALFVAAKSVTLANNLRCYTLALTTFWAIVWSQAWVAWSKIALD